jgi:hypothetical protein
LPLRLLHYRWTFTQLRALGGALLPADKPIGWLDRVALPQLKLLRRVSIGRHRSLILAERKGRKSVVFISNLVGHRLETMTLEEAWSAAKILSGENPGPGAPLTTLDKLFGLKGTSLRAAGRLDVVLNPGSAHPYNLVFRGAEGRQAYELDASEAGNFVAVLHDMKGGDNWDAAGGESTR